jgi:hypothetical protein
MRLYQTIKSQFFLFILVSCYLCWFLIIYTPSSSPSLASFNTCFVTSFLAALRASPLDVRQAKLLFVRLESILVAIKIASKAIDVQFMCEWNSKIDILSGLFNGGFNFLKLTLP